jgi:hypothetical protein
MEAAIRPPTLPLWMLVKFVDVRNKMATISSYGLDFGVLWTRMDKGSWICILWLWKKNIFFYPPNGWVWWMHLLHLLFPLPCFIHNCILHLHTYKRQENLIKIIVIQHSLKMTHLELDGGWYEWQLAHFTWLKYVVKCSHQVASKIFFSYMWVCNWDFKIAVYLIYVVQKIIHTIKKFFIYYKTVGCNHLNESE